MFYSMEYGGDGTVHGNIDGLFGGISIIQWI